LIPFQLLNAEHWYDRSYKRRRRHELMREIEANERESEREIEAITLSLQRKNRACQAQIAALNAD
jgi:hypothetical protein